MPGAELSLVEGHWSNGQLTLTDNDQNLVASIGQPTTGVRLMPAGSVVVVTSSATLDLSDSGRIQYVNATTEVVLTLPGAASTEVHGVWTIINGKAAGSVVVLSAITTELIVGGGHATSDVVTELSSHVSGDAAALDKITLKAGGSTTGIYLIQELVGTWVSTS